MNFEEKLGIAKNGSRDAYGSLCLRFADKLYAAALLSLKNGSGAEKAVSDAIYEGFDGISRIKDERHLCSWLVHELTKYVVDTLKEYKTDGIVHTASGSLAAAEKMPDVERLVFAISSVFGYSDREISVLLGMPENIVSDKIASAKTHLGTGYDRVMNALLSAEAPAALKKRLSAFDEQNEQRSLADVLNIPSDGGSADAEEEAQPKQDSDEKPYSPQIPTAVLFGDENDVTAPVHNEEPLREEETSVTNEPAAEESMEQSGQEEAKEPEPEKQPEPETEEPEVGQEGPAEEVWEEAPAEESIPEAEEIKDKQTEDEPEEAPAEDAAEAPETEDESVFAEDNEPEEAEGDEAGADGEEYEDAGAETEAGEEADDIAGYKLDAATFIAVVSAERMKGSEFLRLIGNTRISNSAFREIESNPKLTKSRLIELLESSPLTENDYYKMLTAIKERREVLDAKEENRLALEKAGLYDGSRRKKRRRRTPPKTELQLAIGMSDPKNTAPLRFGTPEEEQEPVRIEQYRPGFEKPPVPVQPSIEFRVPEPEETAEPEMSEPTDEPLKISAPTADEEQEESTPEQPGVQEAGRRKNRLKKNGRKAEQFSASVPPSLGDIVSVVPRTDDGLIPDDDNYDDEDGGAVDPFAAIAANETGPQAKPEKLIPDAEEEPAEISAVEEPAITDEAPAAFEETQKDEAPEPAEETPAEETADDTFGETAADESTEGSELVIETAAPETADEEKTEEKPAGSTVEFDVPLTSISDTKTFDKIIPIPFADEISAAAEAGEPEPELPKPAAKHTDKWDEPISVPAADSEDNEIQPFRVEIPGLGISDDDEPDYDDEESGGEDIVMSEFSDAYVNEPEQKPESEPEQPEVPAENEEAEEAGYAAEEEAAVGMEAAEIIPEEEGTHVEEAPVTVEVTEEISGVEVAEEYTEENITEEAAGETAEEEETYIEPVPEEKPKPKYDLSVTQIISDYAIGESNPYVDNIIDPEEVNLSGYSPNVDLIFESDRKRGRKEESLEFTSDPIPDPDFFEYDDEEEEADDDDTEEDETDYGIGPGILPKFNDDEEETEEITYGIGEEPEPEIEPEPEPEPEPEETRNTDIGFYENEEEPVEEEPDEEEPVEEEPVEEEPDEEEPVDEEPDEEEPDERPRYKGNEYFYDDNEYYEGVNRGKVIVCAVCAALLTAGSVGMKFLAKPAETAPAEDRPAVTEEAPQTETSEEAAVPAQSDLVFPEETEVTKLASLSELTDAKYGGSFRASASTAEAGYMRASAEPYAPRIMPGSESGVITDGNTAYIYANDYFRKVTLARADSGEATVQPEPVRVDGTAVRGYTVIFGELYVISETRDAAGEPLHETTVTVYDNMLSKKDEYTVTGDYAGAAVVNGKPVIAAVYAPDKADGYYGGKKPSFAKNGSVSELSASDIYAIDGAKHNALYIVYSVGGKAVGVLGGYTDGYSDPEKLRISEDGITLVTVDEGVTYAVDITEDMEIGDAKCYMGEAFGAQCLRDGALIGQLPDGGGITAYKNGTYISTQPEGEGGVSENARNIAWSDNGIAFVVAEQGKTAKLLYGFDMSGDAPAPADVTSDYIYTDRLSAAGDDLVGLKAEPTPDGERAGLRLSLYRYENGLKETAYSIIELDKDTSRDNLKYLSSPAEANSSFIAVDETGTLFAVPTVYFDGFSEVERIVILRFDGAVFSQIGEHMMYDEKSSVLCPVFMNGNLYIITDTKLITLALSEP